MTTEIKPPETWDELVALALEAVKGARDANDEFRKAHETSKELLALLKESQQHGRDRQDNIQTLLYVIGQVAEALDDGNLEAARAYLETVTERFPTGTVH